MIGANLEDAQGQDISYTLLREHEGKNARHRRFCAPNLPRIHRSIETKKRSECSEKDAFPDQGTHFLGGEILVDYLKMQDTNRFVLRNIILSTGRIMEL